MKKNKFKELYNNYKKEENKKNENALCREIINNSNFIVCEKENSLDTYRDENEKLVLKVYTELNEINEYVRNQFTTTEVDFNTIWSTINRNMLDKIIINPESDRFILSNEQVNDLYRQDKFGDKISYRTIKKNFMQEKSAYKVENIKSLNNKIIEIYKKYVDSNNENDLNDFYKELVYNSTFYTRVLPEDNGKLDSNNNPIIDYTRVMQNFLDDNGNERCYILYLTTEALKKDGAKEDMYVAEFNFDDYVCMIDKSWDIIQRIVISDVDFDINIPLDTIYELKVQKDLFDSSEDIIIIED